MTKLEKESGRSMVEMLGVLAIMGVLSVGGLSGYTIAMNKHKANELLSEASKRAVVTAGQALFGKTGEIPLLEFPTEVSGGTFGSSATVADGKIALTVSGVAEDVCTQMKTTAGENSIVTITGDCTTDSALTLTYNQDLTNTDSTPATPTTEECKKNCGTNAECYCQCEMGIWQPSDDAGTGNCKTGITGCTDNSCTDCSSGTCYCHITSSVGDPEIPDTGTCENLEDGTPVSYNSHTFYVGPSMSWWAARNWCLAHDKTLANLATLGLTTYYFNDDMPGPLYTAFTAQGITANKNYWLSNSYDSSFPYFMFYSYDVEGVLHSTSRNSDNYALCE